MLPTVGFATDPLSPWASHVRGERLGTLHFPETVSRLRINFPKINGQCRRGGRSDGLGQRRSPARIIPPLERVGRVKTIEETQCVWNPQRHSPYISPRPCSLASLSVLCRKHSNYGDPVVALCRRQPGPFYRLCDGSSFCLSRPPCRRIRRLVETANPRAGASHDRVNKVAIVRELLSRSRRATKPGCDGQIVTVELVRQCNGFLRHFLVGKYLIR